MLRLYLKLSHDSCIPRPFQYVIHQSYYFPVLEYATGSVIK
jgi:hypothetical protein